MAENVREIVLDTLLSLERGEALSHNVLKAVLDKYDFLDGRDKAFIKRLTEGVLERKIELDYYLDEYSSVPVRKMKPFIRCLMRMGVYQIVYMDSVPDSAAVNEACKLAGKRKFQNLKGFVNAVLRKVSAGKSALPLPDDRTEPVKYLQVKYSMPEWIVMQWLSRYGREGTEKILEGMLRIHPVSLRFRKDLDDKTKDKILGKIKEQGVELHQSSLLPYIYLAYHLEGVENLPGYAEGYFVVQDASSAMAVEAADIAPDDFVMDICAAPGGKTMLAAEMAKKVLARDVSEPKTARIQENLERMRLGNVQVEVWDATVPDERFLETADVVFMDVPCSGLGVMGKKRDIKYHVSPQSLAEITALQKSIVENSWRYVKPGGTLLYSTCTINPAENEEMVQWICERFPFSIDKEGVQLLPGFQETDGFFFAKLRRER
ncbi:MAG: 16S rRNA (cytosine(967)-C(5))-methyltransferase RsmB [Acetatifactor sp.]|nr:16S rRNA (cytosine(967)-C(5))-methyltransferase RsmB [Acetatifactor sp.]